MILYRRAAMRKRIFSLFQANTQATTQLALDDPMDYSYHHGQCPEGLIALGIDAAHMRRIRQAKKLDAVTVGLWWIALLGVLGPLLCSLECVLVAMGGLRYI